METKVLPRNHRAQIMAVKNMAIETADITLIIESIKKRPTLAWGEPELEAAITHLIVAESKLKAYNAKVEQSVNQLTN